MRVALAAKAKCSIRIVRLLSTSRKIVTVEKHVSAVEIPHSRMLLLDHVRTSLGYILDALYRATLAYMQGFKVELGEERDSVKCV